MGSPSKSRKPPLEIQTPEEDRISNLPDSLLSHILSLLPTRYAFRTTLLSRRWKYLFASAHTLDLELLTQIIGGQLSPPPPSFVDFINKVFIFRRLQIDKFRLVSNAKYDPQQVNTWISAALFHNAAELDLHVCVGIEYALPFDLCNSENLTVLKLGICFEPVVPSAAKCFPSLKTLHLTSTIFDAGSSSKLFSACPVLEELMLCNCYVRGTLRIEVPTLQMLGVKCTPDEYHELYDVFLEAPSLEYLSFNDSCIKGYGGKKLNSLVEAHLALQKSFRHKKLIGNLFPAMFKVESLYFLKETLKVLCCAHHIYDAPLDHRVQMFPYLTRLEIRSTFPCKTSLIYLLQMSPNLELLIIADGSKICDYNPSRQQIPSCVSSHLKEIEFSAFHGQEHELMLAKYFLENATLLQKMDITSKMTPENELSVTELLLSYPRGSKECSILFN